MTAKSVSSDHFSYHGDRKVFMTEASQLDALSVDWQKAITIKSAKTGKELTFTLTKEIKDQEGEIVLWEFTNRHLDWKVTVFND